MAKVKALPRISWSRIANFQRCPKRYVLDNEGWTKGYGKERRPLLLGTAVHSALETALAAAYKNPRTAVANPAWLMEQALYAIGAYRQDKERQDVAVFSLTTGQHVNDIEYRELWDNITYVASEITKYHLPRLGIGRFIEPVGVKDLFTKKVATELGLDYNAPAVELKFTFNTEGFSFTGMIDAIVRDLSTNQLVLIDWKVRERFTNTSAIDLDNQMALYAAVVNHGISLSHKTQFIDTVQQVQIRAGDARGQGAVPAPPRFTAKGPSTAKQRTTWEVFAAGLAREGIDPNPYYETMRGQLKDPDWWLQVDQLPINDIITAHAGDYLNYWANEMLDAEAADAFPGVYNGYACKFCPFQQVCRVEKCVGLDAAADELQRSYVKVDEAEREYYGDD